MPPNGPIYRDACLLQRTDKHETLSHRFRTDRGTEFISKPFLAIKRGHLETYQPVTGSEISAISARTVPRINHAEDSSTECKPETFSLC